MAEVLSQRITSPSRKRDHEGELIKHTSLANEHVPIDSDLSTNPTSRQSSPAPSTDLSDLTELTSSVASPSQKPATSIQLDGASNNSTPAKKRKLNFLEREAEKAAKKREKEERERVKAEEKARREDEKRQKDEEKRQKEEEKEAARRLKEIEKAERKKAEDAKKAEREEKKKVKDLEKQEKDAEKAQKEAEKLKKDKAQLRIGSFFGRPAPASTPPTTPENASTGALSRRSSIASIHLEEAISLPNSVKPSNPDFEKYIIPYFVHEHTELAPINRFEAARSSTIFDGQSSGYKLEVDLSSIEPIQRRFSRSRRNFRNPTPVKQIVKRIQSNIKELHSEDRPVTSLQNCPLKVLSFREDVRPPYMGTYTTIIPQAIQRRMSRKPTYRGRPDTNYDYDSEAEWEPPADDDDEINLEDEMSESEDEDEEMQDFLDDEDDIARRKLFVGEMEPISSGLCWQGVASASNTFRLEEYRMDVLHDATSFPIDPFASVHWSDEVRPKQQFPKAETKMENIGKSEPDAASMPPPRLPLAPVSAPNLSPSYVSTSKALPTSSSENVSPMAKPRGRPATANKESKMISDEFLPAFKQAINGSDLTKTGLIEILKKQFPKCSKDAIKDTLGAVAVRVGKKEADKKWELV